MNAPADRVVVAVCSGRIEDVRRRWEHNIGRLDKDDYLVVMDCAETAMIRRVGEQIATAGGMVHVQGERKGLSAARNHVLAAHPDRRILFLDDDAYLDCRALDAIRDAFNDGAEVVGARLLPPPEWSRLPWFMTTGQMHLLGWHAPWAPVKIWGACMGVDASFAARHGLTFDLKLGRTGRRLESGDDTSFIARMKEHGARETVLPDVGVVHDVHPERVSVRYLTRRAYWQGRSEVRRGQGRDGLRKEWRRYRNGGGTPRAFLLSLWYVGAVAVGIAHEAGPIRSH
ncbi:MAG: glycosyltransferase family 2 protein [Pseudonocardiaceae bacterium]